MQQLLSQFWQSDWPLKFALYVALLGIIIILEGSTPARRGQPFITAGFWQDIIWYIFSQVFYFTILAVYVSFLELVYHRFFEFLTVDVIGWPPLLIILVPVLIGDFLKWLSHYVRHKVDWFWLFHEVHHSQREMNIFTDLRLHPLDRMISHTVLFIPLFMFQNTFPVIFLFGLLNNIYTMFYHGNVKTNFGWFRYVLVTPQSHRVHHSDLPEHRDKNFGLIFSIWDHIFGTQYRNYNEYPGTGIEDIEFPMEQDGSVLSYFETLWNQLIYPFKKIIDFGGSRKKTN